MPSKPSDVVERLRAAAALPNGLYAEAATLIEQQAATIRELQAEVANPKGTDNG